MKKFRPVLSLLILLLGWSNLAVAQSIVVVSGVVLSDETNDPISGVKVTTDTGSIALTRANGAYTISAAPGTTLLFQHMSQQDVEYTVPDGADKIIHNIRMQSTDQVIDDVVVVAYGTRKKGTLAGSVGSVKSSKLENVPAPAFDQAMQGQVPGLMVLSNSGEPGAPPSFRIRGTNSINSGTSPLFILDGLPISPSDFNTISPADIESVSVLRDAAATSIYGARAANGVMVITTKRGKQAQKATVTVRTQAGFSQLAHGNWNLMNTAERIQYEKEIGLTAGKDYDKLGKTNINWLDKVFRKTTPLQSYDLNVSGASDRVSYYISGGYFSQEGVAVGSDFSRYHLRANVEAKANDWLKVGTNTMLAYEDFSEAVTGAMAGGYVTSTPIAGSRFMLPYWNPYNPDGSLASINDGSWKGLGQNPLEWSKNNPSATKKYKLITGLFAEVSPIEGLTIRTQGGIDYSHYAMSSKSMPSYMPNNGQGKASRSSTDMLTLTITNTVNYKFKLSKPHDLNVMVGQEGINYQYEGFNVATAGQNNDALTDVSTATRATSWSNVSTSYGYVSFFGRGEYNYDNRYFLEGTVRTDGSSRFGSEGRWAGFGSLGAMWNVRNEKFIKESTKKWLTNAQVSLSSGTSGNSSIPNYDHLALVTGNKDYMGTAGIGPMSLGNEKLKWEKTWTTNLGLRAGFWNRLNVDLELYNKNTSNMLMLVPTPYTNNGYGFRWDNVGRMVNRGVELNVEGTVIHTKAFMWTVGANISYNKNTLKELYAGVNEYVDSTTGIKYVVGRPIGEFFLVRYAGVNPANGDQLWYTKDGQITNEYNESDKVMTGKSADAPWQGGFNTNFGWKGLTLSAQFTWVADRWMMNNDRFFEEGFGQFDMYNQSKRMLYDRWKNPGDITDIPRHGSTGQFDTHLLENASFLRLKNLMISYSLPKKLLDKTKFFTSARINAQAQNLLTFTSFTGLDPESSSNMYQAQYPMSRQFTFGLDFTF